jgi:hypothetical protein
MKGKPWTSEQIRLLRDLYPHKRTVDIVAAVGHPIDSIYHKVAQIGMGKTDEFRQSNESGKIKKGNGIGTAHRFKKGHATWNKGMKGLKLHNGATCFKPGNIPKNHMPVGSVVKRADGYNKTKIAEPNIWELTHRVIWMEAGNELPVHPAVLRFKDGNQQNCTLENLVVSSKKELMAANSVQTLPDNLRKAIQLHGVLLRKINGK